MIITPDKNSTPHWFVGYTRTNQERKAADKLASMGIESFVPVRREKHKWSDRIKTVEVVLIPSRIFIRCTESQRLDILRYTSQIFAFMNDNGPYHPLIVPDRQLNDFKALVDAYGDKIEFEPMVAGDRVRIIDGPLSGMEGTFVRKGGMNTFAIEIESIGYATVSLSAEIVEKI